MTLGKVDLELINTDFDSCFIDTLNGSGNDFESECLLSC